jgi:hypothetical protein
MTSWYGVERDKSKEWSLGITTDRAAGWFAASEEDMNLWIERFGVKASGTIDDFKWDAKQAYSDGEHYDNDDDEEIVEEGIDAIVGGAD